MAIVSIPSAQTTLVPVVRNAEVIVQSFARSATTEMFTVTLGSGHPTDAATSEGPTNAANAASTPNSSGLSQEALGGIIGGIVGAVILILFSCVCCRCVKRRDVRPPGSTSSRSSSSGSFTGSGSSHSRSDSSSDGGDYEDGRGPGTAPIPGGPIPAGAMPPRAWGGGPPPGMGPPPGAFPPMTGVGRGGPHPMMGRGSMPMPMPMPTGRAGPPPAMAD